MRRSIQSFNPLGGHDKCFVVGFREGGGASPSVDRCIADKDRLDVPKIFQGQRAFRVEINTLFVIEIWAAEKKVAEGNAGTTTQSSTGWREQGFL